MVYVLLLGWIGTLSAQTEAILTFDEVLKNGSNAVDGRNSTTRRLAFVKFQKDGVAGLNGIPSVTIRVDGKHVYVTGAFVDTRKMLLIK
jgi:hypothetical protein